MQQDNPHVKIIRLAPEESRPALHDATEIVARPSASHSKSLRRWAWAVLKAARGEMISQSGLNRVLARQKPRKGGAT
jgi:DNA-binding NarL/FixJ family response regulator